MFRSMPAPLLTFELHDSILEAASKYRALLTPRCDAAISYLLLA